MFFRKGVAVFALAIFLSPLLASADGFPPSRDKKNTAQALNEMNLKFTPPKGWSTETNYAGVASYNADHTAGMQIMSEGYNADILSEVERFLTDLGDRIHAKRKVKISGLQANYIEYSFTLSDDEDILQRARFNVFHSPDKKLSYKVVVVALESDWKKQLPIMEKSLKSLKLLAPQKKTSKEISIAKNNFLIFSTPLKNIKAQTPVLLSWQLDDPSIKKIFPTKGTYVALDLITVDGKVVGSIGDGFPLDKNSWQWNVSKERYSFVDGGKYKIRATLLYQPAQFTCDPVLSKGKDCSPAYSKPDKVLIDKAKKYTSESAVFTIKQ